MAPHSNWGGRCGTGQPVLLMASCQLHNWPLPQSCIKDSHLETPGNIPNLHSPSLEVSIWKIPGRPRLGFPCITRIRDQVRLSEVPSMSRAPQVGMTIHAISVLWGQNSLLMEPSGSVFFLYTLKPGHPTVTCLLSSRVLSMLKPSTVVERERRSVPEARMPWETLSASLRSALRSHVSGSHQLSVSSSWT